MTTPIFAKFTKTSGFSRKSYKLQKIQENAQVKFCSFDSYLTFDSDKFVEIEVLLS